MKKITLIVLLVVTCCVTNAQVFSEAAIFERAKKEGVSAYEYPVYLKREKAAFENSGTNYKMPVVGPYTSLLSQPILSRTSSVSTCANLDFENSNFGGWGIFCGANINSLQSPSSVSVDPFPSIGGQNILGGMHVIQDSTNSTALGFTMSVLSNYSGKTMARLNNAGAGAKASILERQFTVTSNQPSLNFSYAVFLGDAGHAIADQPYINIVVFDSAGLAIPSTSLSIVASNSVNIGFIQLNGNPTYFYKPWTAVNFNLSAFIGQTVTFQAIASDCTLGGHSGYAYFDFDCGGPLAGVPNTWPGDANYDLTVNYLDLFYVGAGFGQTGNSRINQGNSWAAAASNNWNSNSLYLVDSKHADCDGNGAIGFSDTTAIFQNYGLGHAFKPGALEETTENSGGPKNITIFPSSNNIYAGQPFDIDFNIGSSTDLVDSIYAIGFTLNHPYQYLDNSLSVMDCSGSVIDNSPLGHLNLFKWRPGKADLVLTKNNKVNAQNIQGTIFSLKLRAATVITNDVIFNLGISGIKAITKSGAELPLTANNYQIKFKASDATGLVSIDPENYSIFPNPASDKIKIRSSNAGKMSRLYIYSLEGKILKSEEFNSKDSFDVDVNSLEKGVYIIKLGLENGAVINKQFIKF